MRSINDEQRTFLQARTVPFAVIPPKSGVAYTVSMQVSPAQFPDNFLIPRPNRPVTTSLVSDNIGPIAVFAFNTTGFPYLENVQEACGVIQNSTLPSGWAVNTSSAWSPTYVFYNGQADANFTSEFAGNVWRLRFEPVAEFDERPVTVTLNGNLGSDGATRGGVAPVQFNGYGLNYLQSSDGGPGDPPVVHLVVPSDPQQQGAVTYTLAGDNVTITAANVKLPLTMYFAATYADQAAVVQSLLADLELQAGPAGPDAPRFGQFELSVQQN